LEQPFKDEAMNLCAACKHRAQALVKSEQNLIRLSLLPLDSHSQKFMKI